MGAPRGNQNARKENRIFGEEVRKAITQNDRQAIRAGIEKVLGRAANGDLNCLEWLASRSDGQAASDVKMEISWDDGEDTNPVSPEAPSA